MKKAIFAIMAILVSTGAMADQYVHGYTRQNGTYVQPYERSSPNSTRYDNYSTRGNVNPYTGQLGTESATPPVRNDYPYGNQGNQNFNQ